MKVVPASFKSSSRYDDVWTRDTEICPYCAHELAHEVEKCPECARDLVSSRFRYEKPSTNLHILWVLLGGLGQLYLINGILDIIVDAGIPFLLLHGLLTVIFFSLTIGVYYRQAWAHISTIVVTLVLLFVRMVDILGFTAEFLPDLTNPLEALFISPFLNFALDAVNGLQVAALVLALLCAALFVGPDFDRKKVRQRARLDPQLREAASFYVTGRNRARRGQWAAATLHWQRAVALAPANRHYHRQLGEAYSRLGFLERSYDALQTARDLTVDPVERQQVEQLLARIQRQFDAAASAESHGK